jgi:hypothetical protein
VLRGTNADRAFELVARLQNFLPEIGRELRMIGQIVVDHP